MAWSEPAAQPQRRTCKPTKTRARVQRIKLLSMGEPLVGKSCIIKRNMSYMRRFCEGQYVSKYVPTIGVDYGVKSANIPGHDVRISFFDLAGQAEYAAIRTEFYDGAQGALLVYRPDVRATFEALQSWLREAQAHGATDMDVTVVANKRAKSRREEVSASEATEWARTQGCEFAEVDPVSGEGIDMLFATLAARILQREGCTGAPQSLRQAAQQRATEVQRQQYVPTEC